MTITNSLPDAAAGSSLPRRRAKVRRAWRALRVLIADPERTDKVIEFINCVGGNGDLRAFTRFCLHPEGRRLLAEKPSLVERLSDLDALAALPAGTFGRAYADFMRGEQLAPDGILNEFRQAETSETPDDPDLVWWFERIDTMHDLWHVLTGYGRDEAGEAANLAFTQAQFPNRGVALLTLSAVVVGPKDLRFTWPRYMYRAWKRGRRAAWLILVRYEDLLDQPLADVRRALRIAPPELAHPEGVIVGTRVFSAA